MYGLIGQSSLGADAAVRAKLELHLVDTIGAWIAACSTAEGKALIAFRNRMRAADKGAPRSLCEDIAAHVALVRRVVGDVEVPLLPVGVENTVVTAHRAAECGDEPPSRARRART